MSGRTERRRSKGERNRERQEDRERDRWIIFME
jgi:hypothetical protein